MKKNILVFVSALAFSILSKAQNAQEFEIIINGKKERVTIGRQYKFVTPKGDTVVYQLNDIPKNAVKDQPKLSDKPETTATNFKEEKSETKQELSEVERLKEKLREEMKQKTEKTEKPATAATPATPAKPAEPKKETPATETKPPVAEKAKELEKANKRPATPTAEAETKKTPAVVPNNYEFKKYYAADQNLNASNITKKDTLIFVQTELSVYKDFPHLQFGTGESFSLCYDYVVKSYHGYDEELAAKHTSRYRVCHVGTWSDVRKSADVYVDTPEGKKKLSFSIVKLNEKDLVLKKR